MLTNKNLPAFRPDESTMTESELEDLFRRAASQHRAATERALADLDLTPAQYAVLCAVSEAPGISAAEVARLERLTPPTMSVIVANLLRKNALAKRAHPENARVQQLTVTELGAELLSEGEARMKAPQRRILASLPDGAEASVTQWLRAIAESSP